MTASQNTTDPKPPTNISVGAKLVPATTSSLQLCSERLASDHLVAFPTETVYGLGAHAFSPTAISKIYSAKGRPKTDPLIVHVLDAPQALSLWKATSSSSSSSSSPTKRTLERLTQSFFPGPLTLISRAIDTLPPQVTAHTGYVAVRSPSHPVARELLSVSSLPIAAPSANKYGHVSPTSPRHVMVDMEREDVWVVDGGECGVGVESTVVRVEEGGEEVTILRYGAVGVEDLRGVLDELGVQVRVKGVDRVTNGENRDSPGMSVRHYSPNVLSFMVNEERWRGGMVPEKKEEDILRTAVIIDFEGRLKNLKDVCLEYKDLSEKGRSNEAAMKVFDYLRWAEEVKGATRVFFPQILSDRQNEKEERDGLIMAVNDRLTRAASGVIIDELQ